MKLPASSQLVCITFATITLFASRSFAATLYVDVNSTNPVPPYTNWATAANVIQDAVDAAVVGDTVWVTNGTYNTGGKVMADDLTNRVVLDKAVTLRSVNGAGVTTIQGQDWTETNALRCAWMTNGAVLRGFRLLRGASGGSGGGVWCNSTNCLVELCSIEYSSAESDGGGAYRGTLSECDLIGNQAGHEGGGAWGSVLANCQVKGNTAHISGGGVARGTVTSSILMDNIAEMLNGGGAFECVIMSSAIVRNEAGNGGGGAYRGSTYSSTITGNHAGYSGGGYYLSTGVARNCVVYNNTSDSSGDNYYPYPVPTNWFQYSCSTPLPSGSGNISADPELVSDGIHITEGSPCRGAGNALYSSGTDIDGQPWTNSPSMGCDEWYAEPVIAGAPVVDWAGPIGSITLTAVAGGSEPLSYLWLFDGSPLQDGSTYTNVETASLEIAVADPTVAGGYQMVASNAYGMTTGHVGYLKMRFVSNAASTPQPPYSDWGSAAKTIQQAVDASSYGEVVVVTNGTYADGGRSLIGDLTNRVAIDREIFVLSVNGPDVTIIQGSKDPVSTNGPAAVRCVCMDSDGAAIKGFTLTGGATLSSGLPQDQHAGGILGGNGLSGGTAANCKIANNDASVQGGGADYAVLVNCEVYGNRAQSGAGVSGGAMFNTIVSGNTATLFAGGLRQGAAYNSIIYQNSAPSAPNYQLFPYNSVTYSCTYPARSGSGNIANDPLLMSSGRVAIQSPCRGMGSAGYVRGVDIDGEVWLNPPPMGCDEVYEAELVGLLLVSIEVPDTNVVQGVALPLTGLIEGRAARLAWDFDDGVIATNVSYITSHSWTNAGDYTLTFTAYNMDNPSGVSTNTVIHVLPLEAPLLTSGSYDTNSTFSLEFTSQAGVSYLVEQATNLTPPVVWSTVTTRTGSGGTEQVNDSAATNAMRFYRVSVP